jgi:outer membrane protein assembly factor BamB
MLSVIVGSAFLLTGTLEAIWRDMSPMTAKRESHTAVLLNNGDILVAGGATEGVILSTCELWDDLTGIWGPTMTPMGDARRDHSGILLQDGTVLVAGGQTTAGAYIRSCEIYNPSTGIWTLTDSLAVCRGGHVAVRLHNGKVMVSAGLGAAGFLKSCEIYDPVTGTWSLTDTLNGIRQSHAVTVLQDGRLLSTGGCYYGTGMQYLASCDIYDTVTSDWIACNPMSIGKYWHTATLMTDGRVLVAGGRDSTGFTSDCEVFDPSTGLWAPIASMIVQKGRHTSTLIESNSILVTGGENATGILSFGEVYNVLTGQWTLAGQMSSVRSLHSATLLPGSRTLIIGGTDGTFSLPSCEMYVPLLWMTSPKGGEVLYSGSMHEITWDCYEPDSVGYFNLLYSSDGGITYPGTVATGVSNTDTSFSWLLPPVHSAVVRVKLQAMTTGAQLIDEIESGNFYILTYPIVISPNGGEVLAGWSTDTVRWMTLGAGFDCYRLLYSADGGTTWDDTIVDNVPPLDSAYAWQLPPASIAACRVKVQILNDAHLVISEDISDADFAIQFSVSLDSPNGWESVAGDSIYPVRWHPSTKSLDQGYRLLCSTNSGITYPDTIARDMPCTQDLFLWHTPAIHCDSVRVKIQALDVNGQVMVEDASDADFKIDSRAPAAVDSLKATDSSYTTVTLEWVAPGDDSLSGGTCAGYDVRYAPWPISSATWDSAAECGGEPVPSWPGSPEVFVASGLEALTPYYFAMKTRDRASNWSKLSNMAFSHTGARILARSQYPMFRYNEQHSGGTPYAGAQSSTVKWYFETSQSIFSSPVVAPDSTVYIVSENDTLYALYPDGSRKWGAGLGKATKCTPAITIDKMIYIGDGNGNLRLYDCNGDIRWTYSAGGSIISSPVVGADGTVYFGSTNDTLYAVKSDGTLRWKYGTGGPILSSPVLSPDGDVYIGASDGKLYAINQLGMYLWSLKLSTSISCSPVFDVSADAIYVGGAGGKLYAIDSYGVIKWVFPTNGAVRSSPAIGSGGAIFFGSHDSTMYALNPNGTLKWAYRTANTIESSPTTNALGMVYVGCDDGTFYCFRGADGTVVWHSITGGAVRSSPAVADSSVYVGSDDGRLYAYGRKAPVTLTSPNGDEEWNRDSDYYILWNTTDNFVQAALYYTPYVDSPWVSITDSTGDDGVYEWHTPTLLSSEYLVKVVVHKASGDSAWDVSNKTFSIAIIGIEDGVVPGNLRLLQNYPNPFSGATAIRYELPVPTRVEITVYNLLGQKTRRLVDMHRNPGSYTVRWDGRNESGNFVASGLYFCILKTDKALATRKIHLISKH